MPKRVHLLVLTALFSALGALALPLAHATVMVAVPLEELVATSDAIVHARVVSSGSRMVLGERGTGEMTPHTLTELLVVEWLAGTDVDGDATTVTVDEIGGTYPGGGMIVAGTPAFHPGEEVVVFLSRADGRWRTRGMVQGLFVVRPAVPGAETMVVRDTSDVGFARWDGGPMTVEHGGREEMALDAFLAWIRDTVSQLGRIAGGSGSVTPGSGTVGGAP